MGEKIFIKALACKLKMTPEDALTCLAKYEIIKAIVPKVTLSSDVLEMPFDAVDIPLPELIVLCIAKRGMWEGDDLRIRHLESHDEEKPRRFFRKDGKAPVQQQEVQKKIAPQVTITVASFEKRTSITSAQLFVFEEDFLRIEPELNIAGTDLDGQPSAPTNGENVEKIESADATNEMLSQQQAPVGIEEGKPQLTRAKIAELWEEALGKEMLGFAYSETQDKSTFERRLRDFINIEIKGTTNQYKLTNDGRPNIARDMKEVKEKIVPYYGRKILLAIPLTYR